MIALAVWRKRCRQACTSSRDAWSETSSRSEIVWRSPPAFPSWPSNWASCAVRTGGRRTARVVGLLKARDRMYEPTVRPARSAAASITARSSAVARKPIGESRFRFLFSLTVVFSLRRLSDAITAKCLNMPAEPVGIRLLFFDGCTSYCLSPIHTGVLREDEGAVNQRQG